MALRNFSLRVPGAAGNADEFRAPLGSAAKHLGSRFFTVRPDADDLLANIVFDIPDESRSETIAVLLSEAREVLPSEFHRGLVVDETPDRPHEISAQLLEDKRRGRAILPGALQAPEDLQAWDAFLREAPPRGLIELGTASGAFAIWLNERVEWFKTIDIGMPNQPTPGFVRLDVWDQAEQIRELVSEAPRPFILYCDNGNKQLEVETFAPALRVGDFLAVHDFGTEIFEDHIPAEFAERLTAGLTGFYEKVR